jgi:hypothetical protein
VAVPLWAHPRCRGRRCWRGQVHAPPEGAGAGEGTRGGWEKSGPEPCARPSRAGSPAECGRTR